MFVRDWASIKDYIIFDVLLPKSKDLIFNLIDTGASSLIYGTGYKPSKSHNGTYVSYNNYSSGGRKQEVVTPRRSDTVVKDIVFDSPVDAENVREKLIEIISDYGEASVGDLYDMTGQETQTTDWKWGWKNLDDIRAIRVPDGYILDLPKPKALV